MQMNQQDHLEYINEVYQELTCLNNNEVYRTTLVMRKESHCLYVRKEIPVAQGGIYQQIRSICHTNLIVVQDVCFSQDKCTVLEEYVSGRTLEDMLEERGSLGREETLDYLYQILDGLEIIHRYHIIHRDLKPENILISTDGVVKLLDFGIARFQKENQPKDTAILGTVGYASPEQFGFRQTDARTDIYAVGILLNVMMTGSLPDAALPEGRELQAIVRRCTQIDPQNRYESVQRLRRELEKVDLRRIGDAGKAAGIYAGRTGTAAGYGSVEGTPVENGGQKGAASKKDQSWIPGFRTGVEWKKAVACLSYIFFFISGISFVQEVAPGGAMAIFLEIAAIILYMWMPVVIGANLFRWDRRVPGIRSLPRGVKITLRVILCFLSFYAGGLLENYVKYVMVGLPRTNV